MRLSYSPANLTVGMALVQMQELPTARLSAREVIGTAVEQKAGARWALRLNARLGLRQCRAGRPCFLEAPRLPR